MPQGPHQLADFVGLDTCQAILSGWIAKYPEEKSFIMPKSLTDKVTRVCYCMTIQTVQFFKMTFIMQVAQGQLRRKTGQGFYKWQNDKPVDL